MPETAKKEGNSISLIEMAVKKFNDFKAVVTNNDQYTEAGDALKKIKDVQQKIEEFFGDDIQKAYDLHRSLTGKKKALMEPLTRAESAIKNARIAFTNEQNRLRQIEQDKLDKIARDKEAAEKAKLDKKIEKAEAKGDTASVDALQQQKEQVIVHVPQAASRVNETAGISTSKKWKGEVTDLKALVKAISDGKAPIALVEIKQSELDALAKVSKADQKVDGCRFYEIAIERVR